MALALVAGAMAQPAADCRAPAPRVLIERYLSADCNLCWAAVPPSPVPAPDPSAPRFVLDWIVPSARGEDAPLAVAALPEARDRVARGNVLRDDETLVLSTPLPGRSALALTVLDGPAWNGYVGLQWQASYASGLPLPKGASGWLALVENVPAGSEGTPVARRLVRTLVGPLPLEGLVQGRSVDHLRAVRLPENAKPERLSSVGWIETAAGKVLAIAERRDPRCAPP